MPHRPPGLLSKHKRTLKKRREYLVEKQAAWNTERGTESSFFKEEIEALNWCIEAIEAQQKINHIAARAARGLPPL